MKESRRRFSVEEYEERKLKVLAAMTRHQLDLLVITDPANMCWLTGYDAWSFYVHQCVVLSSHGDLFWFGRGIDVASAQLTTDIPAGAIFVYPDECVHSVDQHPMQHLADIVREKSFSGARIGVEMDNHYFTALACDTLRKHLPAATISDATSLVNWQRVVKSAREIEYMMIAGSLIEKVYEHVMTVVEPGMAKNHLVAEILYVSTRGTEDAFGDYTSIAPLIGAGDEAAASHMTWDGSPLERGSGMFLELAAAHGRYHCPCSRTLFLGEPEQKYRDIEMVIAEGIEATLPMFKPGVTCGEVAGSFFDLLEKHGYEKDNRCGYSIGLSYPPDWGERTMSLRRSDRTVLQENMTLHFMPAMWFDDWGFEMTESVRVTPQGGVCLANVPRQLLVK